MKDFLNTSHCLRRCSSSMRTCGFSGCREEHFFDAAFEDVAAAAAAPVDRVVRRLSVETSEGSELSAPSAW